MSWRTRYRVAAVVLIVWASCTTGAATVKAAAAVPQLHTITQKVGTP